MSELKTPLVELLLAFESMVPEDSAKDVRDQFAPFLNAQLGRARLGLDFFRTPSADQETLSDFRERMLRLRREEPLRFATVNFRCVISCLFAILENDQAETMSGPMLLLMIQALGQTEKHLLENCCNCPLKKAAISPAEMLADELSAETEYPHREN